MEFQVIQDKGRSVEIDFGTGRNTQGFYQLAKKLETILSIHYNKKNDHFNTLTWNYSYQGVPFILHHHWGDGTRIKLQNSSPTQEEEVALNETYCMLQHFQK